MTTKLPPSVKLGKDDETLSDSSWAHPTSEQPVKTVSEQGAAKQEETMPVSDERYDDEEIQPGDLVIELGGDGVPVIYTQPEMGDSPTARKVRAMDDLTIEDTWLLARLVRAEIEKTDPATRKRRNALRVARKLERMRVSLRRRGNSN